MRIWAELTARYGRPATVLLAVLALAVVVLAIWLLVGLLTGDDGSGSASADEGQVVVDLEPNEQLQANEYAVFATLVKDGTTAVFTRKVEPDEPFVIEDEFEQEGEEYSLTLTASPCEGDDCSQYRGGFTLGQPIAFEAGETIVVDVDVECRKVETEAGPEKGTKSSKGKRQPEATPPPAVPIDCSESVVDADRQA